MAKVSRVNVRCPNGKQRIVNLTPNSSILQMFQQDEPKQQQTSEINDPNDSSLAHVALTNNTYILEEVCQKEKLDPDDFDICHYNKPLDLTLPVRFANLSNNAQLELQPVKVARKACLVTVGLQLESGERIMKDFVPSTTVWDVVEQCLNTRPNKDNFSEKGEPVCVYMRQTLVGKSLKETTLHGLGLTKGSAVIRLMYRNPEDLADQAHLSTPLSKPKEAPPVSRLLSANVSETKCDEPMNENIQNISWSSNKSDKPKSVELPSLVQKERSKDSISIKEEKIKESCVNKDTSTTDLNSNNKSGMLSKSNEMKNKPLEQNMKLDSDHMDIDASSEVEDIGAIHYVGGRHAVLYSLDDITDVKKADLPDEFFELTIDDVKYLMEQFKKTRQSLENQPLLTKELRNRHLLQKLGRFKKTVIRIYFPERLVLQAVFEAQETVQDVCNFIREYLEDKNLNFYLYTTPPKEKKDPSKTLIESMLIPAAVMYFGSDKHSSNYLLKELKEKVSDPRAASLAAYESRKEAFSETEDILNNDQQEEIATYDVKKETDMDSYKVPATDVSQTSGFVPTSGKSVPKWFKMSKK